MNHYTMYRLRDWLELHFTDKKLARDVAHVVRSKYSNRVFSQLADTRADLKSSALTRHDCLEAFVKPAMEELLGDSYSVTLLGSIEWSDEVPQSAKFPCTIDHGAGMAPEICILWDGTANDLISLAHEVAHAVQIQLSGGAFMPPVARETCAFLGELAVISQAQRTSPALAADLARVWSEDDKIYLGDDASALLRSLDDDETPYDYRMNYPLARALAVALYEKHDFPSIRSLFAAGGDAMRLLPLETLAGGPAWIENGLPPLPLPGDEPPAVGAYRMLGAMALLDIEAWRGDAESRIGAYYAARRDGLQANTLMLATGLNGKPLGYALWNLDDKGQAVLRRQCAPFGDHLVLQRMLARRLRGTGVISRHESSARVEQRTW